MNPLTTGDFTETEEPFTTLGRFGVVDLGNGFHATRHRCYDADLGRFLQRDPLGFLVSANPYAYAESSPLTRVDPTGLESTGPPEGQHPGLPPELFDPKRFKEALERGRPKGGPVVGAGDPYFILTSLLLAEGKIQDGLENLLPYNVGDILTMLRKLANPDGPPAYRVPMPVPIPDNSGFSKCSIPHTIYK